MDSFGGRLFDAVLDTVGSQPLYKASPGFLKANGLYVDVGSVEAKSQLNSIWRSAKNATLPVALGGVPRKYVTFSAPLSGKNAEVLASYVEENKLRIFLDSEFALEDVLEVRRVRQLVSQYLHFICSVGLCISHNTRPRHMNTVLGKERLAAK